MKMHKEIRFVAASKETQDSDPSSLGTVDFGKVSCICIVAYQPGKRLENTASPVPARSHGDTQVATQPTKCIGFSRSYFCPSGARDSVNPGTCSSFSM